MILQLLLLLKLLLRYYYHYYICQGSCLSPLWGQLLTKYWMNFHEIFRRGRPCNSKLLLVDFWWSLCVCDPVSHANCRYSHGLHNAHQEFFGINICQPLQRFALSVCPLVTNINNIIIIAYRSENWNGKLILFRLRNIKQYAMMMMISVITIICMIITKSKIMTASGYYIQHSLDFSVNYCHELEWIQTVKTQVTAETQIS